MRNLNEDKLAFLAQATTFVACRLMLTCLPDTNTFLVDNPELYCSVAFLAWQRGTLAQLDALLDRWQIGSKGTSEFRGRIRESWLTLVSSPAHKPREVQRGAHNVLSALAELATASYLADLGLTIVNLAAWDSAAPDVVTDEHGSRVAVEVKYLDASPEELDIRATAPRQGGVAFGWIPNETAAANYFYARIAEAVLQLERSSCVHETCVFLIFDCSADKENIAWFCATLTNGYQWHPGPNGGYDGLTPDQQDRVLCRQPSQWITDAGRLTVCTWLPTWELQVVKEIVFR